MQEIDRIIRVDHAGEAGAIGIYGAQLFIARVLYKDMVLALEDMIGHEREHFSTFDRLLKERGIRRCYGLALWVWGGTLLGVITTLMGRNAIWVCTNAIETTVLHHLQWQLAFLKQHDAQAYTAVLSIKSDEEAHQKMGQKNGNHSLFTRPIFWVVQQATECAIWLSKKL
tara:strand:- start:1898 stop:2407 length:510 start_codon:yes stop_codon:yes gene_type:complete